MASVKISVVGAGSTQFCTTVIRDLCVTQGISGSHIALIDIDPQRLARAKEFAERMKTETKANLTFSMHLDNASAFPGSDFVINTAAWRPDDADNQKEHMAKMTSLNRLHGNSLISLSEIEQLQLLWDVAADVVTYCPNAWLLMIANPVFEGTTLLQKHMPQLKMVGLCHGHYGYQEVARIMGLDPAYVTAKSCGVNHRIFMYDFRYKGEDAYPLLDKWINEHEHDDAYFENRQYASVHDHHLTRGHISQYRMYGLLPIGDTVRSIDWWLHTSTNLERHLFGTYGSFVSPLAREHWAWELAQKDEELDRVMASSAPVTDTYPPVASSEQVVPIIDSMVNDITRVFQINWINSGEHVPGLDKSLAVESEGIVCGAGIFPIQQPRLPENILQSVLVPKQIGALLKADAFINKSQQELLQLMLLNGSFETFEDAKEYIRLWLTRPGYDYVTKRYTEHGIEI